MYNDVVSVVEPVGATDHRFDFRAVRKMQMPWYKRDDYGDHLMLEWQGARIDESDMSSERI